MSKKHFIELADVIRKPGMLPAAVARAMTHYGLNRDTGSAGLHDAIMGAIATELADFCKSQNGMFNRERWMSYIAGECGPNGGKL